MVVENTKAHQRPDFEACLVFANDLALEWQSLHQKPAFWGRGARPESLLYRIPDGEFNGDPGDCYSTGGGVE